MISRKKAFSLMELVLWFFVSTLCLTVVIKAKSMISDHLECQNAIMYVLDKTSVKNNSYNIEYNNNTTIIKSENTQLLNKISKSLKKMNFNVEDDNNTLKITYNNE